MKKIITNETFGRNLKTIRLNHNLSQEKTVQLLQLMGSPISRSTYSLIELGRCNIFISDLVGLQKIFQIDFAAFFTGISTEREGR